MRKGRPLAEGAGPLFLIAGGQCARIRHMAVFLRLRLGIGGDLGVGGVANFRECVFYGLGG
jgi:hypothetical protein